MDTVALSAMLERTTYILEVYQGDEKYSEGTGFCCHEQGFLVTAAHVVTSRLPIKEEDWRDSEVTILAHTMKGDYLRYEPVLCGITVEFPGPLDKSLQVDLAILRPTEPRSGMEYLQTSSEQWPPVGTQVLMAGFPDELESPLRWTEAINYEYPSIKEKADETKRNVERINQQLMIKSGMIGNVGDLSIDPDGTGQKTLEVGYYYVDNVMHSGASGGPVINLQGLVIGTLSQRAVTTVPFPELEEVNKEIPSGSAMAISAFTIMDYINDWV